MVIDDLDDNQRLYLGPSRSGSMVEVVALLRERSEPMTMAEKNLGQTRNGEPITDELLGKLVAQAEAGFDVDEILRRRGGRPPMGSSAASVESVRLDPELSQELHERAKREGRTNSDLIRDALRRYLEVS